MMKQWGAGEANAHRQGGSLVQRPLTCCTRKGLHGYNILLDLCVGQDQNARGHVTADNHVRCKSKYYGPSQGFSEGQLNWRSKEVKQSTAEHFLTTHVGMQVRFTSISLVLSQFPTHFLLIAFF